MPKKPKKFRAICLVSGGLDSLLSAKIVQAQGIDILGVNFTSEVFRYDRQKGKNTKDLARDLGIPLRSVDVSKEILAILKNPKHGFGSNINPCIDCHIMMLKRARVLMKKEKASFLVTGEVVGQRPMSQGRKTLSMIDKEANVKGLVLRPLSAKVLSPSLAEEKAWVDRQALYGISGRTRKDQMALAKVFKVDEDRKSVV